MAGTTPPTTSPAPVTSPSAQAAKFRLFWNPKSSQPGNEHELLRLIDFLDIVATKEKRDGAVGHVLGMAVQSLAAKDFLKSCNHLTAPELRRVLVSFLPYADEQMAREAFGLPIDHRPGEGLVKLKHHQAEVGDMQIKKEEENIATLNFDAALSKILKLKENVGSATADARLLKANMTPQAPRFKMSLPADSSLRRPENTGSQKFVYRVVSIFCSYEPADGSGQRFQSHWGGRGMFLVVEPDAVLRDLEAAFLDMAKELEPHNYGVLSQARKVIFYEENGPPITGSVWNAIKGLFDRLEAEICF